ncbi:ComEC/Rec2 family competence protein [Fredinandcohnia humi]
MKLNLCVFFISVTILLSGWTNKEIETDIEKINVKLSEDEMAMTFLDMPNGEATLLHFPNGEYSLLNTGGRRTEKELREFLEIYGVNKLHSIIVTKDDHLYTSNLEWLINEYKDVNVIIGEHNKSFDDRKEINSTKWSTGELYNYNAIFSVHVVHEGVDEKNSLGMDLLFRFGNNQVLYMTSSNKDLEHKLLNDKKLPSTNVFKVADFGDLKGSDEKFVDYVNPQIAVIFHKRGLLPSQDVLERLSNMWIDIYYTKQFGSVTIKFTHTDYEVITIPLKSTHPQVEES